MKIYYNPKLKAFAKQLRNNSTKSEIKMWNYLKGEQLYGYRFIRQKPIDEYIVDFFCNRLGLAIECDGYSHQILGVFKKDVKKTRRLNQLGLSILRFSDTQIMGEIDNVIRAIEEYILVFEANNYTAPDPPLAGGF